MAAAPVKMETDGASMIKSEPDSMQIPQLEADDAYEDTGELEMPPQPQDVWLLRIPRPLFSHWNSFADDQEIQLGVMRRSKRTGKLSMELDRTRNPKLELSYTVNPIINHGNKPLNAYIFSEKDLPGYRKAGSRSHRNNVDNKEGVDKKKRYQNRVIPKSTRLAQVVKSESFLTPVENEHTKMVRIQRQRDEDASRKEVKLDMEEGFAPEIQSIMNLNKNKKDMMGFARGKAGKQKSQEQKAARLPKNELLDKLMQLFRRYQYWSMRALRETLVQPEAYLKEVLEPVADLVRSGRFNGNYTLKPEYRAENFNFDMKEEPKEEAAPEESDLEALSGGDDDDEEMSDVKDEPT